MGRPTISDIAGRAGVSTATVDRALNARPGVTAANRQRVLQAAQALGYLPSEGTVPLPSRPAHLEFFVPVGCNSFMADVVARIGRFAGALPVVASCSVTVVDGIGPEAMVRALDRVALRTGGVGLVSVDHPAVRAAIGRLCDAGVQVVTIASDVGGTARAAYVGVDNRAAGRTAALLLGLAAQAPGSVALFLGTPAFAGHRERAAGFRGLLAARFADLAILPAVETVEQGGRARTAMALTLRTVPDLVGVYCVGAGRGGIVEALRAAGPGARPRPFTVVHDLTDDTVAWLRAGDVDAVIDQNAHLVAEQSVIRLLGAIAAGAPPLSLRDIAPRLVLVENIPAQWDGPAAARRQGFAKARPDRGEP